MVARINVELMRETGAQLRVVATEFEHANARSDAAAEACGHGGLAERVREFAHNWDDRREKMVAEIGTLGEAGAGIGDAFQGLDEAFVAGLMGET